jgi:hypothetical protein
MGNAEKEWGMLKRMGHVERNGTCWKVMGRHVRKEGVCWKGHSEGIGHNGKKWYIFVRIVAYWKGMGQVGK